MRNGPHGGDYISLTTRAGDDFAIDMGHLEQLESEFERYTNDMGDERGHTVDKALNLTMHNGGTLRIGIAAIAYFAENTEEQREATWKFNRAVNDRKKELYPDWEDK